MKLSGKRASTYIPRCIQINSKPVILHKNNHFFFRAVIHFPSLYLFPIIVFVLHAIIIAIAISVFVYLYSVTRSSSGKTPGYLYGFHFLNIFGLIWIMAFVTALAQMILSGSFATWYWTFNKRHVPHDTVLRATTTTFRWY